MKVVPGYTLPVERKRTATGKLPSAKPADVKLSNDEKWRKYHAKERQFWTGLCFAKLLDFNGDDVDELVLVYQTETSKIDNVKYHVELWTYDGKTAKKITSRISWTGNNIPYFGGFSVCKYNGKYLLELTDNAGWENYYYGTKSDGSIGLVHKFIWKGDAMQGNWYHNGKKVSNDVYQTYYNKYHSSSTWYGFSQSLNNNTIKNEISKTKKKLNM